MIEFTIEAAGCAARIRALHESTKEFCAAFLCAREADFSIEVSEADILLERQRSERTDMLEERAVREFPDAYLETLAVQRKLAEALLDYDTLLFHGSVVAVDGFAYLFTAKSGTGKSTHTRLWREVFGDRAVMINDDKPFLRMENGRVVAYGSPWNGKHRLGCNDCAPLEGLCILERGEENVAQSITAAQALPMLMQQSQRPMMKEHVPQYLKLLDGLAGGTEFYRMKCNMDPEAAWVAYGAMSPFRG